MDITERYTTRGGKQYLIRLSYNERLKDTDGITSFIKNLEILDVDTNEPISLPVNSSRFSTYERFKTFGGYTTINYFGVRETAIEALRLKVLTRVEDHLETLEPAYV
ncbi:hypothetical protein [Capsulimonas corticalis]|nr:hypothetical protein [Capsulimonas corticalis]